MVRDGWPALSRPEKVVLGPAFAIEKKKKATATHFFSRSLLLLFLLLSLFFALAKTLPLKVFSNLARAERCRRRCSPEGVLLLLQAWASRRRRRRRRQHKQSIVLSSRDEPRARFTGTICAAVCMNE